MPRSDVLEKVTVGITGLDAGDNPHPGTAVALALRADPDFRGRIVALPYDPMVNGAFMENLFDAWAMMPWPGDSERLYVEALARARRDHGIDVVMPCLDSDVPTIARLRDLLQSMGIAAFVPPFEAVKRRFKWNLTELCAGAGIDTPRTAVLYDIGQIHPLGGWTFPLYVKGSLADAELAHDHEEAEYLFRRMAMRWGYPVMIQEKRAGVEYLVAGVASAGGVPEAMILVKKVRTTIIGKATAAVTVNDDALTAIAAKLLGALHWEGPFELEFMKDASNGRFYLIEINGRFPAWISFAPHAGSSVVTDAVRLALGRPPLKRPVPPAGTFFSRGFHVETGGVDGAETLRAALRSGRSENAAPADALTAIERLRL